MSAHGTAANKEPLLFPDPVIEAYIKDVDRTILRENLRHSVAWRLENFASFMRGVYDLRREAERSRHPQQASNAGVNGAR